MNKTKIIAILIMGIILIIIVGIVIFANIYGSYFNKIEIIKKGINIKDISISIEEYSITNTEIKIIIENENEFIYSTSSGDDYIIYYLDDNNWNELQIQGRWNGTELMTMRPSTKRIEEEINWKDKYGKLEKGRYRLERNISINSIEGNYYIEFEIK